MFSDMGLADMADELGRVALDIQADSDADAEELSDLASRLREELLELDVGSVESATAGPAPDDAKGLALLAFGGLVVKFVLRQDVLETVVAGVRSWVGRQRVRSVKLTLDGDTVEITGVSTADEERLVDLWIARHVGKD
jgi:hypothetical protein